MAQVTINLVVAPESREAMDASIRSVFNALFASGAICETLADRFPGIFQRDADNPGQLVIQGTDGILGNRHHFAASPAGHQAMFFDCSDEFLKLAATVAGEADLEITDVHGWPVLSLGSDPSSVAEAGGVGNLLSGGGAS